MFLRSSFEERQRGLRWAAGVRGGGSRVAALVGVTLAALYGQAGVERVTFSVNDMAIALVSCSVLSFVSVGV